MDVKRSRHVGCFDRLQSTHQIFNGRVFVMVTAVARIGLVLKAPCLQAGLWVHESEGMAVRVPCLSDARYPRHVAADTAPKCVNPVSIAVLYRRVAALTQCVLKQPGLGDNSIQQIGGFSGVQLRGLTFVDVVAGDADHTNLCVFALLPVQILLVAVSGLPAGPEIFGILLAAGFVEIEPDIAHPLVGLVIRRIGIFPRFVPAPGVTGAANLSGQGRR